MDIKKLIDDLNYKNLEKALSLINDAKSMGELKQLQDIIQKSKDNIGQGNQDIDSKEIIKAIKAKLKAYSSKN